MTKKPKTVTAKPNCSAIKQGTDGCFVNVAPFCLQLVLLLLGWYFSRLSRNPNSGAGEKCMLKRCFNNGSVSVSQWSTQVCWFFALRFHLSLVYSSSEYVVQELGRYLFDPTCSVIRWYINASYSTSNLLATDLLFRSLFLLNNYLSILYSQYHQ